MTVVAEGCEIPVIIRCETDGDGYYVEETITALPQVAHAGAACEDMDEVEAVVRGWGARMAG